MGRTVGEDGEDGEEGVGGEDKMEVVVGGQDTWGAGSR